MTDTPENAPVLATKATTFLAFPAHKVDVAKDALAKLYSRLVRAAARTGAEAPAAPTLTASAPYVVSTCDSCRVSEKCWVGGTCIVCKKGHMFSTTVVDLDLVAPAPRLAGWEFLAVVTPLTGGNLIKKVPGADTEGFDFAPWRTGALKCTHCNTVRDRKDTFLVRATGEGSTPAGTVKEVGRNCLKDFLGGKSAAWILGSLAFEKCVEDCLGEGGGGGGGRGELVWEPVEFLSWTAASIRLTGWLSRSVARDTGKMATADHVLYLLVPPFGGDGRARWHEARTEFRPTAEDSEKAKAALAWAKALTGASDYEANLKLVANEPYVTYKLAGLLASAVAGYDRAVGEEVKRRAFAAARKDEHFGTVGDKVTVTLTCEAVYDVDTAYGTLHINKFRDAEGRTFVWKTTSARFEAGKSVTLKGTVKAHGEYKGRKETELTRCKEVDPNAPAPVKKLRAKKAKTAPAAGTEETGSAVLTA